MTRGLHPRRTLRRQLSSQGVAFVLFTLGAGWGALAGAWPPVILLYVACQITAGVAFVITQRKLARR